MQPTAGLVLVENQVASAAVTNSIVVAENQVASAAMGRNLTERDEETSSTKWHAQFWSQTTLLLLLLLSLSLSHGTAEKNRPLHSKHEEKKMHCAEGDGRWHQDKIDPVTRAQHHVVVFASTLPHYPPADLVLVTK